MISPCHYCGQNKKTYTEIDGNYFCSFECSNLFLREDVKKDKRVVKKSGIKKEKCSVCGAEEFPWERIDDHYFCSNKCFVLWGLKDLDRIKKQSDLFFENFKAIHNKAA